MSDAVNWDDAAASSTFTINAFAGNRRGVIFSSMTDSRCPAFILWLRHKRQFKIDKKEESVIVPASTGDMRKPLLTTYKISHLETKSAHRSKKPSQKSLSTADSEPSSRKDVSNGLSNRC